MRYPRRDEPEQSAGLVRRTVDASLVLGLFLAAITTLIYVFSPVDVLPDILPLLGQVDDLAAALVGGGAMGALMLARVLVGAGLRSAAARRGCLAALLIASIPVLCGLACLLSQGLGALAGR